MGADMVGNAPMIEVPRMTIAGHEVGPVWFTGRADRAFHEYMAQWMDRPLDGALGGSAFRYFRVLVNYPEAYAEWARHVPMFVPRLTPWRSGARADGEPFSFSRYLWHREWQAGLVYAVVVAWLAFRLDRGF